MNALRHGLTAARAVVLPDEDGEAFEALRRELMADLAPEGALQGQLADRACVLMWRLSRAARLETELFTYWDLLAQRNEMEAAAYHEGVPPHLLALARDESEDRGKRFALALSIDLEIAENASLARALHEDGQASRSFDRLSRYEGGLQRALNRTLDEFWRLRRMGAPRAVRPARSRRNCETKPIRHNPLIRRLFLTPRRPRRPRPATGRPRHRRRGLSRLARLPVWSGENYETKPIRRKSLIRRPVPAQGRRLRAAIERPRRFPVAPASSSSRAPPDISRPARAGLAENARSRWRSSTACRAHPGMRGRARRFPPRSGEESTSEARP